MSAITEVERLYDVVRVFAELHEADTRDLLQELFIRPAQRPDLLDRVRDVRTFLLRLSHNLAIPRVG